MLDEFIIGRVDRISPEAPVPVVVEHNNLMTLGGCGNVIRNLLNIGVNIGLLPTKGLTLPFISYGGTSLLVMMSLIAIVVRINNENKFYK